MSKKKIARKPRSTKRAAPKPDTRLEHARTLRRVEAEMMFAIRDVVLASNDIAPVAAIAKASRTVGAVATFLEGEVRS